ncbi:phasin family protein [Calderihabitans maritimus]|uniref:ATP synthase subunit B n=1 Tax=Calderihabitans maritimus TaxID=1246530 RepID=A0A1Z5HR77_9FIRM|nr:hypothetical protein [Calderihabitans maritimus]GAW91815.1 hypothetical protein HM1_2495 [Calderihabitans maritimus]
MLEWLRKGFLLGLGAMSLTREKAEQLVEDLVKKGQVSTDEAKQFVEQLVERGREEREQLRGTVQSEVQKVRDELGLVTRKELEELEARVKALEERLQKHDG